MKSNNILIVVTDIYRNGAKTFYENVYDSVSLVIELGVFMVSEITFQLKTKI